MSMAGDTRLDQRRHAPSSQQSNTELVTDHRGTLKLLFVSSSPSPLTHTASAVDRRSNGAATNAMHTQSTVLALPIRPTCPSQSDEGQTLRPFSDLLSFGEVSVSTSSVLHFMTALRTHFWPLCSVPLGQEHSCSAQAAPFVHCEEWRQAAPREPRGLQRSRGESPTCRRPS